MKESHKNSLVISILLMVVSLLYYFFPSNYTKQIKQLTYKSVASMPSRSLSPTGIVAKETGFALVTKVIDGDTITIEGGQKVRYIGIDTPEIHNPRVIQECFGKEAAKANEDLVLGKVVRLEKDVSEVDRYGRLLRYVYVSQKYGPDLFINEELVKKGYAKAYTYPPDVAYSSRFKEVENEARVRGVGLWVSCR